MKTEKKYLHITSTDESEMFWNSYDALDEEGWSLRHIQIDSNNNFQFSDELIQVGDTVLPETSLYPIEQIINSGFEVKEVSEDEFNSKWTEAVEYAKKNKMRPLLTGVIY